jgi:hypothetical protein
MPRTPHYRSKALSRAQVAAAIAAHDYAEAIGRPLNLTMDVHWEWTRFANTNRRMAAPMFLESLRHFLGHRAIGFYAITVRESHEPYGEHCHVLAHVPLELHIAVEEHARDILRGGKRRQKRALVCRPTYYSRGKLAYILKGSTPPGRELLEQFNVAGERRRELDPRQGIIYGKRLLISQAIGPKARRGASNDDARASIPSSLRQATNVRF